MFSLAAWAFASVRTWSADGGAAKVMKLVMQNSTERKLIFIPR